MRPVSLLVPRLFRAILCLLLFSPWLAASAQDEEVIESYDVDIVVRENSELEITEVITVYALGDRIKRGIFRDFPTSYTDRAGHAFNAGFRMIEARRDGETENFRVESYMNGVRVYLGRSDVMIPRGRHTYTLRFVTTRQVGFFEDHDELYFNAIGTGWAFPIQAASATVRLPETVPADEIRYEAYTGLQGQRFKWYSTGFTEEGDLRFDITKSLGVGQGLTVVVGWPKGHLREPTATEKWAYFLNDNRDMIFGSLGFACIFLYLFVTWRMVGVDPRQGAIIPLYEQPEGLSPADCRFLHRMKFDNEVLSSAIINMAVLGYLKIDNHNKRSYKLIRKGQADSLPLPEREIAEVLFAHDTASTLELDDSEHPTFRAAIDELKQTLKDRHVGNHFLKNEGYLAPAVLLAIGTGFGMVSVAPVSHSSIPLGWIVLAALVLLLLVIFHYLLKAPTKAGRALMDRIEGFKMYLGTAEKERLNLLNPPEMTPKLFERFLPFALALGVDQEWAEAFDSVLEKAARDGEEYRPSWYSGRYSGPRSISSSLGSSFSSAIASASTPPGSRSGFSSGGGGGGSSGGGGGGGGGGGW